VERTKNQVLMDTSKAEQLAGFNISYENSFTAIKRDIYKETVEKNTRKIKTNNFIEPIEERPAVQAKTANKAPVSSLINKLNNKSRDS
jgi:hypothetical protein